MKMKITKRVAVSVETSYQPSYSKPLNGEYVFAYRITVENFGESTIKLLKRHWYIYDSNGSVREVEGEGVVGQQPVLAPMQNHQYVSGCHLRTEMGKMSGSFLMERLEDGKKFYVQIPEFVLVAPFKLN